MLSGLANTSHKPGEHGEQTAKRLETYLSSIGRSAVRRNRESVRCLQSRKAMLRMVEYRCDRGSML